MGLPDQKPPSISCGPCRAFEKTEHRWASLRLFGTIRQATVHQTLARAGELRGRNGKRRALILPSPLGHRPFETTDVEELEDLVRQAEVYAGHLWRDSSRRRNPLAHLEAVNCPGWMLRAVPFYADRAAVLVSKAQWALRQRRAAEIMAAGLLGWSARKLRRVLTDPQQARRALLVDWTSRTRTRRFCSVSEVTNGI